MQLIYDLVLELLPDIKILKPRMQLDASVAISSAIPDVLTHQNRYLLVKYYYLYEQVAAGNIRIEIVL